jgi:hypothetical protein
LKKLSFVLSLLIAFTAVPVGAQAADEDWVAPSNFNEGYHHLVIQEKTQFFRTFPRLENYSPRQQKIVQCDSVNDPDCRSGGVFNSHYPVCGENVTRDCISKFSIIRDNSETMGEFQRYLYTDHVGDFVGDGRRIMKDVESPSIWRVPDVPHKYGDHYLVVAGQDGGYGTQFANTANYAEIYAIELVQKECTGDYCVPNCTTEKGCGGPALDWWGGLNCIMVTDDAVCAVQKPMPENVKFSLDIRTGIKPSGWFHGRMTEPDIQITPFGNQDVLSITAAPVKVPILFFGPTKYSDLSSNLQKWWDNCLAKSACPTSTRIPNSVGPGNKWPAGDKRNAETDFPASHKGAIGAVRTFSSAVKDKSVAAPTYWSYRTLETGASLGRCFARNQGVQGIVTTNAIAYEDGAPKYQRGFLNYRVAGLHYLPDDTKALGTYDLVMRSDLARCLYGFSRAAVSATITVAGEGDTEIATTVVGERNGWLKLAAYGFTFSQKTIQVKLTQPRPTSITCVSEADPRKTQRVTAVNPQCPAGFKKR